MPLINRTQREIGKERIKDARREKESTKNQQIEK
jgi:hypothetical protein